MPEPYSQLMWGLWMLSTRSVWDSYLGCEIRWYDRIQNDEVLQRTGQTSLSHLLSHRLVSVFGHMARLDDNTRADMVPHQHITQPTSWQHVASPTWSSTEQVVRPATKRFYPSDWRPLEACCWPWTWWCNDATALAGYVTTTMIMMLWGKPEWASLRTSRPCCPNIFLAGAATSGMKPGTNNWCYTVSGHVYKSKWSRCTRPIMTHQPRPNEWLDSRDQGQSKASKGKTRAKA